MEITNEIKAKVFAQYLGHRVELDNGGSKVTKTLCAVGGINDEAEYIKLRVGNFAHAVFVKENSFKLILKPLSAITDEDAIDIAVLAGMVRPMNRFEFVISRHINYTKRILSEYFEGYKPTEEIITGNVWLSIYQFLQSKGYDTPQYLLGGKTLAQSGLAIYEN